MNLEVDLNNRITAASALCAEYDDKAQTLGLLDGPIEGFESVPFAQEVNGAAENPVPDGLGTVVKPALQQLRARTRDELKDVKRDDVDVEEKVTKVREEIGELADQEKGQEDALRLVDGEKEKLQDVRCFPPFSFSPLPSSPSLPLSSPCIFLYTSCSN
jgi:kinetochore protein NDC80